MEFKCKQCGEGKHYSQFPERYKGAYEAIGFYGLRNKCKSCQREYYNTKTKGITKDQIYKIKHKVLKKDAEFKEQLKGMVAKHMGIEMSEMDTKTRKREVVWSRLYTCYLLNKYYGKGSGKVDYMKYKDIGLMVRNNPDHSIINYYISKANTYIKNDRLFSEKLSEVEFLIMAIRSELLYLDLFYKIDEEVIIYNKHKEAFKVKLLTYDFNSNHWICKNGKKMYNRKENEIISLRNK